MKRFVDDLDGAKLASEGVQLLDSVVLPMFDKALTRKGGVVFIDEAHNRTFARDWFLIIVVCGELFDDDRKERDTPIFTRACHVL